MSNGSFNGALGDLISRRADFMANACFLKDYLTDNRLEFTNSINDDKLCIVVKTAALVCEIFIFMLLKYVGVVLCHKSKILCFSSSLCLQH